LQVAANTEMRQQGSCAPSVLAQQYVCTGKRSEGAQTDVAEITDRRCHNMQTGCQSLGQQRLDLLGSAPCNIGPPGWRVIVIAHASLVARWRGGGNDGAVANSRSFLSPQMGHSRLLFLRCDS
jgi:hypothetical protein